MTPAIWGIRGLKVAKIVLGAVAYGLAIWGYADRNGLTSDIVEATRDLWRAFVAPGGGG